MLIKVSDLEPEDENIRIELKCLMALSHSHDRVGHVVLVDEAIPHHLVSVKVGLVAVFVPPSTFVDLSTVSCGISVIVPVFGGELLATVGSQRIKAIRGKLWYSEWETVQI